MKGPPLGPREEDITWPDQVALRGRKASSARHLKPQTLKTFCSFKRLLIPHTRRRGKCRNKCAH